MVKDGIVSKKWTKGSSPEQVSGYFSFAIATILEFTKEQRPTISEKHLNDKHAQV